MPANPAIIPNSHRPPILDIVSPALHLHFVRRGEDTHIRPEHDPIADGYETAVQDREVEVGIEAVAERDIAAVVDGEGRLDEDVGADVAEDALQAL